MPKPKDTDEMCDRLGPYLRELTAWLTRRQKEIDELRVEHPKKRGEDPPPKPPDLGQ